MKPLMRVVLLTALYTGAACVQHSKVDKPSHQTPQKSSSQKEKIEEEIVTPLNSKWVLFK